MVAQFFPNSIGYLLWTCFHGDVVQILSKISFKLLFVHFGSMYFSFSEQIFVFFFFCNCLCFVFMNAIYAFDCVYIFLCCWLFVSLNVLHASLFAKIARKKKNGTYADTYLRVQTDKRWWSYNFTSRQSTHKEKSNSNGIKLTA